MRRCTRQAVGLVGQYSCSGRDDGENSTVLVGKGGELLGLAEDNVDDATMKEWHIRCSMHYMYEVIKSMCEC